MWCNNCASSAAWPKGCSTRRTSGAADVPADGHGDDGEAKAPGHLPRIPLGRVAEPKDVAGAAAFLASPAAAFVSGQVLYLDGGLTACQ